MKRKIFSMIGVAAFAVAVAFNINASISNDVEMDVTMKNIEALADGETVSCPGGPSDCVTINGPGGFTYKFYKQK